MSEAILRDMDAQAQLCQRHKLIYAPCIFFENREDALLKPDLCERIAKLLGDRYYRVPGLVFYLWDDGVYYADARRAQFDELARGATDALASNARLTAAASCDSGAVYRSTD